MNSTIYAIMYTEMNIFCIIILLIILVKSKMRLDKQKHWMTFMQSISFLIIYMCCDILWCLQEAELLRITQMLYYVLNIVYFASLLIDSYMYFLYSEMIQSSKLVRTPARRIICALPLIMLGIAILMAQSTGWIFYLDAEGHYVRGPYYLAQPVLCGLYIVSTSSKAFVKAFQKVNYSKKSRYLSLASFMIAPAAAIAVQIIMEGLPVLCIGLTICVLLIYLDTQDSMISIDSLTGMNNRKQLMKFLASKLKYRAVENEMHLYFLIMDIDAFKKINDTFGHNEGDHALALFGRVLKQTCGAFGCFGARYGGDEFVLVYETKNPSDLDRLIRNVHARLDAAVAEAKTPYRLKVSIGAAEYSNETSTIPDLIIAADKILYEEKARKKVERR